MMHGQTKINFINLSVDRSSFVLNAEQSKMKRMKSPCTILHWKWRHFNPSKRLPLSINRHALTSQEN